jgi:hypothetical protein
MQGGLEVTGLDASRWQEPAAHSPKSGRCATKAITLSEIEDALKWKDESHDRRHQKIRFG